MKTKRFCFFIIAITMFVLPSFSQVSFWEKIGDNGKVSPCATIYGTKPFSEKIGFTYFGLVSETWAEFQLGGYFRPTSWMDIGLSFGLEQNSELLRAGSYIWLGKGKTSFTFLAEKGFGKDNYWYKTTLKQSITKSFSIGLRGWRYNGVGPVFQYTIGKTGLSIWAMPAVGLWESENNSISVGIDYKI